MKKAIFVLSFALLFGVFGVNTAGAHFLGDDSVDGDEIRWGGSTTYSTAWNSGVSTWNGLNPIDILPDVWWTWEDLTISDVTIPFNGWNAKYFPATDEIKFNTYYMSSRSASQNQNTTTHELGHALGLGHSYSGEIMYAYPTSQTALGTHDKSDYHSLWGY